MKKIFILSLLVVFTYDAKADMMKDLELSNELLAMSEYGAKASWSTSELVTLENKISRNIIDNLVTIKILASSTFGKNHTYDALLKLPTNINEINFIIENSAIKKKFIKIFYVKNLN